MRCFFYQWRISRALDSAGQLPSRHLLACPTCRTFYERSVRLEAALRSATLTANPLRELTGISEGFGAKRSRLSLAAGVGALAAACMIVVISVAVRNHPASPALVQQTSPSGTVVASIPGPSLLGEAADQLEPLADIAKEPLARQVENTANAARQAGKTLISYLPVALAIPD